MSLERGLVPLVIGGNNDGPTLVGRLASTLSREEMRYLVRYLSNASEVSVMRYYDAACSVAKNDPGEIARVIARESSPTAPREPLHPAVELLLSVLCAPKFLEVLSAVAESAKGTKAGTYLSAGVVLLRFYCTFRDELPSRPGEAASAIRAWARANDEVGQLENLPSSTVLVYLTAKAAARNVFGIAPPASTAGVDHHLALQNADDASSRAASDGDVRATIAPLLPRLFEAEDDNASYWLVAAASVRLGGADIAYVLGAAATSDPPLNMHNRMWLLQRMMRGRLPTTETPR